MPLDAMVLTALRRELERTLIGAKIDRISMPEKDMLILSVHSRENGSRKLLISLRPGSARIHLTENTYENPTQPPMFCMLLRKHLAGARLYAAEQPEGERMLLMRFDAVDELNFHSEKTVALEFMGKGVNLVLTGEDGRIIDCFRRVDHETNARRALLPGLFYELPPAQDRKSFFRVDEDIFAVLVRDADKSMDPDQWLLRNFGALSPFLCRELAADGWEGLEKASSELRRIVREEDFRPFMVSGTGIKEDFSFLPVRQYGDGAELTEYPDFSSLLDAFYSRRERAENMRRRSSELTRTASTALNRLRRKIAAREQELLATEDREAFRRRGDLITANIYRLKRGMTAFEAEDYYEEGCPVVTVPLDGRKTPQQNAAAYYKQYNKAKTASRILTELLASARDEETYLESVLHELSQADNEGDLRAVREELIASGYLKAKIGGKRQKKAVSAKPLLFVSPTGREIWVGRNNIQNDELTMRSAHRGDLWLHVQKKPGSHVIVPQRDTGADEETIRFAADLAATYSSAGDGERTAVDCTEVRNVKKPPGARPGQVIYSHYSTLTGRSDHTLKKNP